jgi:hypothetical protein
VLLTRVRVGGTSLADWPRAVDVTVDPVCRERCVNPPPVGAGMHPDPPMSALPQDRPARVLRSGRNRTQKGGALISLYKDETERPVPEIWRPTISALVDSLVERAPTIGVGVPEVEPVPDDVCNQCFSAVDDYGDIDLMPLPPETWTSSIAAWQGDHWACLIDLWTEQEGRSDLVLEVEVREHASGFRFTVHMVYVP